MGTRRRLLNGLGVPVRGAVSKFVISGVLICAVCTSCQNYGAICTFEQNQVLAFSLRQTCTMAPIIFTCPRTLAKVQHWLDEDDDASENEYESFPCPACTWVHFINRKTGKLLGSDE